MKNCQCSSRSKIKEMCYRGWLQPSIYTLAAHILAYYRIWLRYLRQWQIDLLLFKHSFSFAEEVPSFDCIRYITRHLRLTYQYFVWGNFQHLYWQRFPKQSESWQLNWRIFFIFTVIGYFRLFFYFWWKLLQAERWCSYGYPLGYNASSCVFTSFWRTMNAWMSYWF